MGAIMQKRLIIGLEDIGSFVVLCGNCEKSEITYPVLTGECRDGRIARTIPRKCPLCDETLFQDDTRNGYSQIAVESKIVKDIRYVLEHLYRNEGVSKLYFEIDANAIQET